MTHLWTIGFQIVNFLLLLFLLRRYLWKPVRATIDRRRKEIDDADAGMKARAKAADDGRAAESARTEAADHERARLLAGTAVALAGDRERVLAEARALTDAELRAARAKLADEQRAAALELTDATLAVARTIAQKLLGEVRGAAITGAFLDRICEHLDALPAAALGSLRQEVEVSPTIQVATTPALDDAAKTRLRARLTPHFGPGMQLAFVVDDALIAGAELRFPHARIGHSLQHGLAAAGRELAARGAESARRSELTPHEEIVDR